MGCGAQTYPVAMRARHLWCVDSEARNEIMGLFSTRYKLLCQMYVATYRGPTAYVASKPSRDAQFDRCVPQASPSHHQRPNG